MNPTLVGFIIYLIVVLAVGLLTFRLNRTLADFVIAGRRLGPWVVAFSERASGESAWLLIGLPGLALVSGYNAIWPAVGCTTGILFSWMFISRRLRSNSELLGAITIPDFFEAHYADNSRLLRVSATLIIVFFFTFYVAAQFLAAGKVLNVTFHITPFWGMIIGACIILFYTMMGGFFAVAWTDFFQGSVMVFTLVLLPIVGIVMLGGFGGFTQKIASINPGLLTVGGGNHGWDMMKTILGGLAIGLGYMGQPHLVSRFMAIKKTDSLRQGTLIAIVWAILAYWGAVFIGLVGLGLYGMETIADQEQIMPFMATSLLPAWLAGIAISGAIAAMMSTADSQLLVTTAAISEDIYHQMIRKDAPQERLVRLSRLAAVVVGVVAFILAITAEALVYDLVLYAWAGLGACFGPGLLLTLWWKRTTKQGVWAGMVVGMVTIVIWYNVSMLHEMLYELIPGFFLALFAVWGVSLATGKKE
ncbi:MAG: sodium/proline symporter [bacterium]